MIMYKHNNLGKIFKALAKHLVSIVMWILFIREDKVFNNSSNNKTGLLF